MRGSLAPQFARARQCGALCVVRVVYRRPRAPPPALLGAWRPVKGAGSPTLHSRVLYHWPIKHTLQGGRDRRGGHGLGGDCCTHCDRIRPAGTQHPGSLHEYCANSDCHGSLAAAWLPESHAPTQAPASLARSAALRSPAAAAALPQRPDGIAAAPTPRRLRNLGRLRICWGRGNSRHLSCPG
jgi:hypothetical protein